MKRIFSIFGVLCLAGLFISGFYHFAEGRVITRSTEWAKGKISSPRAGEYDVIVVGSDPEGIAAAIAAGRSGAKVLLLGKEDGPGGLLTYGMLNTLDMSYNNHNELLTRGIFQEFFSAIGRTESFDVNKAKNIFEDMINKEKNLEYRRSQKFVSPILEGKTIIGVVMEDADGNNSEIFGRRIIDATQDGDVCVAAGVPYYTGMEDVGVSGNMAATLVLKVGGVDWGVLKEDISRYSGETKDNGCGINKSTAWGFGKWCYDEYKPIYNNMKLRGPNFGLQDDGSVLINALQIFGVDGTNEESKALAISQGKEEAENVVKHLTNKLKSFKNSYLIGVADELYIRETRHIQGEYKLEASDVVGNRNFWDKIALSSYPVDIQSTSKTNSGYVIGDPDQYSIPYRCIVPQKIDNLFIVGRSASYSSVAAGSARVVPTGMAVGESAGIAAVYTIYKNTTPRELISSKSRINQLTKFLRNQNVYLPEFKGVNPISGVKGKEKIEKLLNLGMLSGGYSNNFSFDKEAKLSSLCNALVNALQRGGAEKYSASAISKITKNYSENLLTGGGAARILVEFFEDYPELEKRYQDIFPENSKDNIEKQSRISEMKKEQKALREEELKSVVDDERKEKNIENIKKRFDMKIKELTDEIEEEYNIRRIERLKPIDEECFEVAKEKEYFSEEFNSDDVLTYRQVYVIAVDAIEKYIGRELGNI